MHQDLKNEFDSLLLGSTTENGATRRTALKVALEAGYAATAGPFFYAVPEGKKNLLVILVVQEVFGVHAYIADVCRRFAKAFAFVVYPQVPHAFHADYRPSYRKDAAEDGFQRTLQWFNAKGVV